jgi:CelD/BcsL family acetyltransferase involved in cellulose biosynthesis
MACIEESARFRALRDEWRHLHGSCPDATPFTSWEWLFSWWQAYGAGKRLYLMTWRLDGALVGIAPLYSTSEKSGVGTNTSVLKMLGDGSADSDYLGFVVRENLLAAVLEQLGGWLSEDRAWDAIALRELPERSALADGLRSLAERQGFRLRVEHGRCGAVCLPATFDEFLRQRQPRFRTKLRSLLKKLDESAISFETDCAPGTLRKRLRSLYLLHQRRWQAAGAPGVFGHAQKRLFYARFVPRFARREWLRLYSLRRGDIYLAHQLCFGVDGVTYLLQEGFDTADPSASYGQMLRAAVMRHLIEHGERRYDFLGGISRHKEDWGAKEERSTHLLMAPPRWRGWLYFNSPLWREQSASAAKRLLPGVAVRMLQRTKAPLS